MSIYQTVKEKIEESRGELTHLEEAVEEQMSSKPKKKRKSPKSSSSDPGALENFSLPADFNVELSDSD